MIIENSDRNRFLSSVWKWTNKITTYEWHLDRVATAQGKQGIWKSIFPDGENTGNLLKNIKNVFLHREFTTNTGKIWVSKKKKKELVI